MCEVLFRRIAKAPTGDDAYDASRWQPGQAVTVKPDGWKWSKAEHDPDNPNRGGFTLIKFPGVDHTYQDDPKDPDNEAKLAARDKILSLFTPGEGRRRATGIDLDAWTKADSDYVEDEKNALADRIAKIDAKAKVFSAAAVAEE